MQRSHDQCKHFQQKRRVLWHFAAYFAVSQRFIQLRLHFRWVLIDRRQVAASGHECNDGSKLICWQFGWQRQKSGHNRRVQFSDFSCRILLLKLKLSALDIQSSFKNHAVNTACEHRHFIWLCVQGTIDIKIGVRNDIKFISSFIRQQLGRWSLELHKRVLVKRLAALRYHWHTHCHRVDLHKQQRCCRHSNIAVRAGWLLIGSHGFQKLSNYKVWVRSSDLRWKYSFYEHDPKWVRRAYFAVSDSRLNNSLYYHHGVSSHIKHNHQYGRDHNQPEASHVQLVDRDLQHWLKHYSFWFAYRRSSRLVHSQIVQCDFK
jgi:hypothetical protein